MRTFNLFLKETRKSLNLQLHEVYNKTKIEVSVLSKIENGKRHPTEKQLLKLAELYNCNKEKLYVHWLSDKLALEAKKHGNLGLEALNLAEEKIRYGKSSALMSDFYQNLNIESRRYIGSKAKLTDWIITTIKKETKNVKSFVDIFAGTASISKAASPYFEEIIINDILHANNIIYQAFFSKSEWSIEKLNSIIKFYNNLNPSILDDNYFSLNYGDKFFDYLNAKLIGYIREDIENKKSELTNKEYCILLSSLIYSIDRIANTVGHFDAYIKKPIKPKELYFKLIQPIEINKVSIYNEDANKLARKIKSDLVYIDPPYNSRQYSRFYHLYENLVKWDKPKLYGVALKPEPENMSVYCTVRAKNALHDLVNNLDTNYIALSYNNTYKSKSHSSENKIKLEEIEMMLKEIGKTKIFECSHKFFNAGKTDFEDHKELLFITELK